MTDTAVPHLAALAFATSDPTAMARFWSSALRWDARDRPDGSVEIVPTDGTRWSVVLLSTSVPKSGQNRQHLDLTTASPADQHASVAQLLELGGRHIDIGQTADDPHIVLADPEGNELCIIEPENGFLADCDRLGAISCDGSQEVGHFWSTALGWPLVWDQDEETAIRAPDLTGPMITWGGPPVAPKTGPNRLQLHLVPQPGDDRDDVVERLVSLGAARTRGTRSADRSIVLLDPDGNEFCVLSHDGTPGA